MDPEPAQPAVPPTPVPTPTEPPQGDGAVSAAPVVNDVTPPEMSAMPATPTPTDPVAAPMPEPTLPSAPPVAEAPVMPSMSDTPPAPEPMPPAPLPEPMPPAPGASPMPPTDPMSTPTAPMSDVGAAVAEPGGMPSLAEPPMGSTATPLDGAMPPAGMPPTPVHTEHKSSLKLVVLVAVLIGLVLAGVAVYFYLQSSSNTEPVTNTVTGTTQEETGPLTEDDIDSASQSMQNTVGSLDDSQDFSDSNLSDETLGL